MLSDSMKLDMSKNKMIPADNLQKKEDSLTDKTREFGRIRVDREKKLEQLKNEIVEMNKCMGCDKKNC